jgi:hypothetical protein
MDEPVPDENAQRQANGFSSSIYGGAKITHISTATLRPAQVD